MSDALLSALEVQAAALNARVVARQYENPFWEARFGARGRRFAAEDGAHHIGYLRQALAAKDPGVLTYYARWLQSVLTCRGMTSRHLDENFRLLAEAILDDGLPDAAEAVRYLEQARAALRYAAGPAQELQDAAEGLMDGGLAHFPEPRPAWLPTELCQLPEHLADSVAMQRPELFVSHVSWLAGFLGRTGVSPNHLGDALAAMGRVIAGHTTLSAQARAEAEKRLGLARQTLLGPSTSGAPSTSHP